MDSSNEGAVLVQIGRIETKLRQLREADRMCALFGAEEHRYRLGRPLSVPDLDYIEGQLGVRLPEEYRLFLARVGHGGAGPYYGLFTLDGEDPEDITIPEQARKDFRWSQAFNPADWEDPCNQEDVWCDEVTKTETRKRASPCRSLSFRERSTSATAGARSAVS